MALPPAILSRFDLVYIMLDEPDEINDYNIAHHIVRVHQKREEALSPAFTTAEIKRYITYAKTINPTVLATCLSFFPFRSTTKKKKNRKLKEGRYCVHITG